MATLREEVSLWKTFPFDARAQHPPNPTTIPGKFHHPPSTPCIPQPANTTQVAPIITSGDTAIDLATRLKTCPSLESLYHETLRTTANTSSGRSAVGPQTLPSGATIDDGGTVAMLYKAIHHDRDIYGADADSFRWDRFVDRPDLAGHKSFRPFGGGAGICPGRFLTAAQVPSLVAMLVTRYEWEAVGGGLPEVDVRSPPIGMASPAKGGDMVVRVRLRREGGSE